MINPGKKKKLSQKHYNYCVFIYFSFFITISLLNIIQKAKFNNSPTILSGIASSMEGAVETIKGLGRFLDSINSIIAAVSSVIGIEVFVLLIAVLLISAAISFLGVSKGKFSFFCSLIIADIFWFLWAKSF